MPKKRSPVLPVIMHYQIASGKIMPEEKLKKTFLHYLRWYRKKEQISLKHAHAQMISYLREKLKLTPEWLQQNWLKAIPGLKTTK